MSTQRIQKLIAQSGFASRRQAEALIQLGRVRVNNKIAQLGDKASEQDIIYVDNQPVKLKSLPIQLIMLNKPLGYVTTRKDPQQRKSVFELLPELKQGRWINVGRLDINTTGLLLFTNDGEFANRLMHPSSCIEREYLCRVYGVVNSNKINTLLKGIKLESDKPKSKFISVTAVKNAAKNQWFKVVLKQGRYREVRRLWQAVGCQVNRLSRIRFANIHLPKDLPLGQYRKLSANQVDALKKPVSN